MHFWWGRGWWIGKGNGVMLGRIGKWVVIIFSKNMEVMFGRRIFDSIQLLGEFFLGNGLSVQHLHFLVLPQYSSFSVFFVSMNGRLGWFWPNLLLCYSSIIAQLQLSHPIGIEHRVPEFRHAHAYLSQFWIKSGTLLPLVP